MRRRSRTRAISSPGFSRRWKRGIRRSRRRARGSISPVSAAPVQEIVNQMLGEGEVSIRIGGAQAFRIQESVFTGLWRVCALDADGRLVADWLEAGALPEIAVESAKSAGNSASAAHRPAGRRDELARAACRDRQSDGRSRAGRFRARDQPDAVSDDARGPRGAGAGAAGRARRDDLPRIRQLSRHVHAVSPRSGASSISTA